MRGLSVARVKRLATSSRPYLMRLGFASVIGFWYLAVEVWKLPRFERMPGPTIVTKEWLTREPIYGLSIYTNDYYSHIWTSLRRVLIAFGLSTVLGVALGLVLGWSRRFKAYVFP